jgi:hypothetical protein
MNYLAVAETLHASTIANASAVSRRNKNLMGKDEA